MKSAAELTDVIKRHLAGDEAQVEFQETGWVTRVGDGIAHIYGLRHAMSGELLAFPDDVTGMVLNLERHDVGAVLFGPDTGIKEGDPVRRTGRIAQVPVGAALLGRVADADGRAA